MKINLAYTLPLAYIEGMKNKYLTREQLLELREEALNLINAWQKYYQENHGMKDEGSSVIGNGIAAMYLPKGKRKARRGLFVTNGDLGYQSEQPRFFRDVITRLTERHPEIEFIYRAGAMD